MSKPRIFEWRKMHASFFTDVELARAERLSCLPPRSLRLVFAGLWVHADDAGRFEWDSMLLRAHIVPFDPDLGEPEVERILDCLVAGGWVRPYEVDGRRYGEIRNFTRYQVKPRPGAVIYPAAPPDDAPRAREVRTRDHVRESRARDHMPDHGPARTVREQQDQQQDHTSHRRPEPSRGRTGEAADDDDRHTEPLPVWLPASFDRAFQRAVTPSEGMLLAELLKNYGELRLRAALEKAERQLGKGNKPRTIGYLTSTLSDLRTPDTTAETPLAKPPGGIPLPTAAEKTAWELEREAEARALATNPTCPKCGGVGGDCAGWGRAWPDEPEDWRCRQGRRASAEDFELELLAETRPAMEVRCRETEEIDHAQ